MKVGINIASFTNLNNTAKKIDGLGHYTLALQKALREEKVTTIDCYFANFSEYFFANNKNPNIYLHPSITQLLPINFYRQLENQIDIFHSTDHMVPKLTKTPVLATLNDAIMLKHADWCNPKLRRTKNFILKKMMGNAQHIITISHAAKQDIIEYFNYSEKNISVVYNGLDEIWLQKISLDQRNQIKNQYQIKTAYGLVVGTLQNRKNIARLLNAAIILKKQLKNDFQIIFVGKLSQHLDKNTFNKLRQLADEDCIKWLEYISFDELRCLYQSAEMLLFPSLAEGFGLPILEGFASGIPVITSNQGALAEVAGDAGYLIDPYSVEEITFATQQLLENKTLRAELINKGEQRVKQFSWQKTAKETLAIYNKFV